jgi:N-acetylglucosaminyldiphosphoundecaprenol N-acetyl-beta-D-mannosaminyltransferase
MNTNTTTVNRELNKCMILGVEVSVTNMKETLNHITGNISRLKGRYICVSNVHTIVMSHDSDNYRHIQNSGFMVLPDGKPLSILSKWKGFRDAQRVTGPDLMAEIFSISEHKGYRHFFYGSTPDTLEMLRRELKSDYPHLEIAGMFSPPFRELTPEEDLEITEKINQSEPDFVWVGLGAPKQELWMYAHREKVRGLMVGVGAGFDYFAKNISRAPGWMQKYSLEWLFRLIQDPGRLWKRYLVYNSRFIFLMIKNNFMFF